MEPKTLPKNVAAKVNEWLGGYYSPSHFWTCGDTFLIIVRVHSAVDGIFNTHCLRVFPMGGQLQLSQDNIIYG